MRFLLNFLYKLRRGKSAGAVKKILFLCPSSAVGDTVVETFFIRELKKLYPAARLTVAIREPYITLLKDNPAVNEILPLPVSPYKKLAALFCLAFRERGKYDLVLDLPWSGYGAGRMAFLYLLKAGRVMSCNTQGYNFITYPLMWTEGKEHITREVFAKALRMLGYSGEIDFTYELYPSEEDSLAAQKFLSDNNLAGKPYIVFNPEGSRPSRVLSAHKALSLASAAAEECGLPVVLMQHKQNYKAKGAVISARFNSVLAAAEIIAQSAMVITVDTGILHVADAYKKPLLILFAEVNLNTTPRPYVEYFWGSVNPGAKKIKSFYSVNDIAEGEIIKLFKEMVKDALW